MKAIAITSLNRLVYLAYLASWPWRRFGPRWSRSVAVSLVIWWVGMAVLYRGYQASRVLAYEPPTVSSMLGVAPVSAKATVNNAVPAADPGMPVLPPGRANIPTAPVHLSNSYAAGNCTYYVASRRPIPPHWGNARSWYAAAARAGWAEGTVPRVGAVAWTPAGSLGHVALVEAISDQQVLVSEMNFRGFGRIDQRWVPQSSFRYIY